MWAHPSPLKRLFASISLNINFNKNFSKTFRFLRYVRVCLCEPISYARVWKTLRRTIYVCRYFFKKEAYLQRKKKMILGYVWVLHVSQKVGLNFLGYISRGRYETYFGWNFSYFVCTAREKTSFTDLRHNLSYCLAHLEIKNSNFFRTFWNYSYFKIFIVSACCIGHRFHVPCSDFRKKSTRII